MLVLSRKIGESISIGDNINIKVVSIEKGSVKLGIDAPKNVIILREELKQAVTSINKEAETTVDTNELLAFGKKLK
jgi:carbon storage regulator